MSVLTAWAAEKFTAGTITKTLNESGIKEKVSHQEVIIPGYVAVLSGKLEGQAMVLEGETRDADGKTSLQRITWTPLPDSRVRQHWQSSEDAGASWTTAFDGYYTRKP